MSDIVIIQSREYWFKIVEMLQQNWALIDSDGETAVVYFVSDTSGVFDEMNFPTMSEAERGLQRNGFRKMVNGDDSGFNLKPPDQPFTKRNHPNGPIYSSGRFWDHE